MKYEDVYKSMGHFGWFQAGIISLGVLLCMYDSEMITMVFVGGHMDHWCLVDTLAHLPIDVQKRLAIPPLEQKLEKNRTVEYISCYQYNRNYSNVLQLLENSSISKELIPSVETNLIPCEKFVYQKDKFLSSLVSQFNLVCGLEFLVPLVSSFYMLGAILGCLIAGCVADVIGRKRTLVASMILRVSSICLFIFAPTIHGVMVGRFFLGMAGNAVRVTHFVLVMEMFGPKFRSHVTTILVCGISCGAITMSVLAKFIRDHFYYQITVFLPILPLFFYATLLLPESARWLHVSGKHEEVNKIWSHIAIVNGYKLPANIRSEMLEAKISPKECETKESKTKAMFTSRTMLARIFIPGYTMLTGSLIYFAIMLNMGAMAGDIYINSCISSVLEIPGYVLGLVFCNNKYTKRRLTVICSMCLAGILQFVCVPLMVTGYLMVNSGLMLLSRALTCSMLLALTVYSGELLPTEVRNTGFGILMTCGRLGATVAPYMGKTMMKVWKPLPSVVFGLASISSGLICFYLPETFGEPIYDTIRELKSHTKNERNSNDASNKPFPEVLKIRF